MSEIAEKGTDIVKVTATDRDLGSSSLILDISLEFTFTFFDSWYNWPKNYVRVITIMCDLFNSVAIQTCRKNVFS